MIGERKDRGGGRVEKISLVLCFKFVSNFFANIKCYYEDNSPDQTATDSWWF